MPKNTSALPTTTSNWRRDFLQGHQKLALTGAMGIFMVCTSIVLADRHPGMLAGIRSLLAVEADAILMVVDEASLMLAVEKVIPDLVIADLSFPVSGGTKVVKLIKQCNPAIKMIILSTYDDPPTVGEIMKDGADGFVLRQRAVVDLIPAVREVCKGARYVSISGIER